MALQISTDVYKKEYVAPFCSYACICCVLIYLLIIFLPFLMAISTNNFWLEIINESEQFEYTFRHEFLLYNLENQESLVFSNFEHFDRNLVQQVIQEKLFLQIQSPSIQAVSYDLNDDGVQDKFSLELEFFANSLQLKQAYLILFFNCRLKDTTKFLMTGMLAFDLQSKSGISEAQIISRVSFKQRKPIERLTRQQLFYRTNIFEENNYDVIQTLLAYQQRDFRIEPEFEAVFTSGNTQELVKINLEVYLDRETKLIFKTSILALIKLAWIQYISLFIPVWFFLRTILRFIYRHRFIYCQKNNNLPKHGNRY